MGAVGYMSPEQVRGQTVDHRADIFAFGAILYEMLAGKRAFQKPTSADTMSAILKEDPPSISQVALKGGNSYAPEDKLLDMARAMETLSLRFPTDCGGSDPCPARQIRLD
jgi:serine/threonine protein kinase